MPSIALTLITKRGCAGEASSSLVRVRARPRVGLRVRRSGIGSGSGFRVREAPSSLRSLELRMKGASVLMASTSAASGVVTYAVHMHTCTCIGAHA